MAEDRGGARTATPADPKARPAARGTGPSLPGTGTLAGVGAVALGVRVVYTVVARRGYTPDSDADSYFRIAAALADGRGFVQPVPFGFEHPTAGRPPLYPAVVAPLFELFGAHVGVAQAVNVLLGAATAVLAVAVGARIGGRAAGLAAGLAVALSPQLVANDVTTLGETLGCLLLLVVVLALAGGRTVAGGAALGLLALTRASAQWLVVALGAWVLWRLGWRHALRLAVVAAVVVAPWVVRNAVQAGGPVLVTTNGFNLAARYSPEALDDGAFVDAYNDPRFARLRLAHSDEVALDDALRRRALDALAGDPGAPFGVVLDNALRWFELAPARNEPAERLDGRHLAVRHATLPLFYVVTAAGAAGLWRTRRSAASQLLAVTAAYFSAVSLVSVTAPRLRAPVDLALAIGAGVFVAGLRTGARHARADDPPRRPVALVPVVALAAVAAVAIGIGATAWRAHAHARAHDALLGAVEEGGVVVDRLSASFPLGAGGPPPRLPAGATDDLYDLLVAVGGRAPQAGGDVRPAVDRAVRALRLATREVTAVGLLSAGELIAADEAGRDPSLAVVARRYTEEVAPGDPTLHPWPEVARGDPLAEAARALGALERALRRDAA
ncbi:MAG: hypothetical protein KatS3mg009_0544 [Acidimicrobiia bacterium]|nr:MAG: hypothetical protein KatS3mg009_0544 [Acidimicrobiia bacterium]